MPVVLVLFANSFEVNGKRRVPIGKILGAGDAGILRHQILVGGQTVDGRDRSKLKVGRSGFEMTTFVPNIVLERNGVAFGDSKVVSRPFVQDDGRRRTRHGNTGKQRRGDLKFVEGRFIKGCYERVGN